MEVVLNNDCTSFTVSSDYDLELGTLSFFIKEFDADIFVEFAGVVEDDSISYEFTGISEDSIYLVELRNELDEVIDELVVLFNCRSLKCYNNVTYSEANEILEGEAKVDNYKLIKAYNRAIIACYKVANYSLCKQLMEDLALICSECSTCNCDC